MIKGEKISVKQLQALMFMDILTYGVITLPGKAAEFAGNDCWLLIPGALVFALVYILLLNLLARLFPNDTFAEFSCKIVGAPLGIVLSLILAGKLIFTAGMEMRLFTEVIMQTMTHTPNAALSAVMTLLCAYLAYKGLETRAKMGEALLYIVLVPLTAIFLIALANADFTNILPLFTRQPQTFLHGAFYVSFAFRGLELTLLSYPFVNDHSGILRGQAKALAIIGLLLTLITCATLLKFGENSLVAQRFPAIQTVDTFKLAGRVFERLDGVILSILVITAFISFAGWIYFSAIIAESVSKQGRGACVVVCGTLVFIASLIPRNVNAAEEWLAHSDLILGVSFMIIIPPTLMLIARLRGYGGDGR